MRVDCYYWGPSDPYSITFREEDEVLWSKRDGQYSDLVMSYLNRDYEHIIEIEDYDCVADEIKGLLRKSYKQSLEDDLTKIDYEEMKRLINYVFLLDVGLPLSARQKYLAYNSISDFRLSYNSWAEIEADASNRKDSPAEAWARGRVMFTDTTKSFHETFIDRCHLIAKNQIQVPLSANYNFASTSDVFYFFLSEMIKNDCVVKICPNCERYFVPRNRSDTLFCHNISPQDQTKTCSEYGKYQNRLHKTRTDEVTRLHRQIYNRMRIKAERYKTVAAPEGNPKFNDEFKRFKDETYKWRADIKAGVRTETEYLEWLHTFNKKEA